MQYLSWWHLSILGISHLLLIRFWPIFKGRFLGPSLTDANYHSKICPGNICPGNICPHQEYFSYCWPNFDQTIVRCLNFFGPKFFTLIFLPLLFFNPKLFWTQIFQDPNFLEPKIIATRNFLTKQVLDPKYFLNQHFFKCFWDIFFFIKLFYGWKFCSLQICF